MNYMDLRTLANKGIKIEEKIALISDVNIGLTVNVTSDMTSEWIASVEDTPEVRSAILFALVAERAALYEEILALVNA